MHWFSGKNGAPGESWGPICIHLLGLFPGSPSEWAVKAGQVSQAYWANRHGAENTQQRAFNARLKF